MDAARVCPSCGNSIPDGAAECACANGPERPVARVHPQQTVRPAVIFTLSAIALVTVGVALIAVLQALFG